MKFFAQSNSYFLHKNGGFLKNGWGHYLDNAYAFDTKTKKELGAGEQITVYFLDFLFCIYFPIAAPIPK